LGGLGKSKLIKDRCFWQLKVPQYCSWCWRKILKLREIAKKFLRFKVGDGTSIYLWLDCWHPDNILYDKYGYRVIYDSRSSMDAKLSSVLNGRN